MKARSPEAAAKSATRWIVAAVVLFLYIGVLSSAWKLISKRLDLSMSTHYNPQEIYRAAWNYTDDYWIHPSVWEEHLEQDAIERVNFPFYQYSIDDVRQRIDTAQEKIDALQSAKEGLP